MCCIGSKLKNTPVSLNDLKRTINIGGYQYSLIYQPQETSFLQILEKLPGNWEPDVVLFFHPEYQILPIDMAKSPYPTVALISDWNLGFETINLVMGCFNYMFTDKRGAEMFKNMGISNIEYKPMYGFSPYYHRRYKNIEKIYDISIIGNLNHKIQKERSKWLKRLSLLSPKYRIAILTGLYKEEYAQVVNQSKITFNRSIRKEMNMRAYEAPACGSLLFYEEENEEIRSVFKDRVHCVLYNEKNLEELLDYYLTHDEEREQIIDNAYKKIQNYSYGHQLKSIINRINEIGLDNLKKIKRSFLEKPEIEQYNNLAKQASLTANLSGLLLAQSKLSQATKISSNNPEIFNNLGVILTRLADNIEKSKTHVIYKEAEYCFQQAFKFYPSYALAHLNLANLYIKTGELNSAIDELNAIIEFLKNDAKQALSIRGLYYPYKYDDFKVEWETILINYHNNPAMLYKAYETLFFSTVYELLGEYVSVESEGDLEQNKQQRLESALSAYQHSLDFIHQGENLYQLACIYMQLGNKNSAIENLYKALESEPFILQAYINLISLLLATNKLPDYFKLLYEFLALVNTCSHYRPVIPYLLDTLISIRSEPVFINLKQHLNNILEKDFFNFYTPYIAPAEIDEPKNYNFLYVWNNNNWQIILNAYLNTFTGNNSISLVILLEPLLYNKENIEQLIADYIQNQLNLDLQDIPDIVLFESSVLEEKTPSLLKYANAFICTPDILDVWYLAGLSMELPVIGTITVFHNDDYEPLESIYSLAKSFTVTELTTAMLSVFSSPSKYKNSKAREVVMNRYKKSIDYILHDYFYRILVNLVGNF